MKRIVPLLIWLLAVTAPAYAQPQKVEIAPGVSVSRKTYRVPANEAPFFNFAEKTEAQKASDQKLVDAVLERVPHRSRAAGTAIDAGMRAFLSIMIPLPLRSVSIRPICSIRSRAASTMALP